MRWSLLFFLLILLFAGCRKESRKKDSQKLVTPKESDNEVTLCLIPIRSRLSTLEAWQPVAEYLSKETGFEVELTFARDYSHLIELIVKKEVDLALFGSFSYINVQEQADIVLLVQRVIKGSSSYRSLLIARKESSINVITDLKGKTLAFIDKRSTSGYLFPLYMLSTAGLDSPEQYLSEVIWAGNHDNAKLLVHSGRVDAAFITSSRWKPFDSDPRLDELKVVLTSEEFPLGPICVRKGLNLKMKKKLKKALLNISIDSEKTKELALNIGIDGFIEGSDQNYNYIREIKTKLEELGIYTLD